MKKLLALAAALLTLAACTPKPQPQPEDYFSFDANGVHYDYPQIKGTSLMTGDWKTLKAGSSSATVGYIIGANSLQNDIARGTFSFTLTQNGNQIPSQDTVLLDGITNTISIQKFLDQDNSYELLPPLSGRIIFSERSSQKLSGTFQFDAYKLKIVNGGWAPTDTILHGTNGKFSIIPTLKVNFLSRRGFRYG